MSSTNNFKELKILSIGNSFSMDTMQHLPDIARDLGINHIRLGNLYIGGCSTNRHYANAQHDAAAYRYYTSDGSPWTEVTDFRISDAVKSETWDWISIQHGTGDGSSYTKPESYENLPALVEYVRSIASPDTRIAFNMAWVMESYSTHREICSYQGDQMKMYENLTAVTSTTVRNVKGLDRIVPSGTAIQNARKTCLCNKLSRDGFHLSYGIGRYIASLTFLKTLTGIDIGKVRWTPTDVTEEDRQIAIRAAEQAVLSPFAISELGANF